MKFIGYCKDCQFDPCNPKLKNCGYIKESTGFLRHKNKKKYRISERTKLEDNLHHTAEHWLYVNQKGGHWSQHRRYILNWHIHDEPPAHLEKNEGTLSTEVYSKIIDDVSFYQKNLKRSYSGLCLAGRSAGEAKIRELCETIKISDSHLSELLTIQNWSSSNSISRMTFFNSRTEKPDRRINNTRLVIADGDDSFLNIIGRSEFQSSDVIGVIHRTMSREKLEEVGNKLSGLNQWYRNETEMLNNIFEPIPYGISINIQQKSH